MTGPERIANLLVLALCITGCAASKEPAGEAPNSGPEVQGAWRSSVRFKTGAFASVEDLQFVA
jgi:hypothetical protein